VNLRAGWPWLALTVFLLAAGANETAQNWTHVVRIAGHGLRLDRVDQIVQSATDTHVFGIETDNDIPGRYESFLDPAEKLKAIRAVADKAHAAGNKAFVYIAGLECITAGAAKSEHSFFKDHPDWVQRKITGEPAVFGGGAAFWIREGDEDVWISPFATEWRKLYMARVRQIAATGIDGVYVDIPYWMTHFTGWEDSWASFDQHTVTAFRTKTGLDARKDIKLGDFHDPGFRRWIDFRIDALTEFMREIDANVKAANPDCMTIAEIYPGLEFEAVRVGADVYDMYRVVDAIAHEYEFEDGAPMAASKTPLDWLHYMIGMYSFRSFAGGKASWMLSYSWDGEKSIDPSEAMKNLFVAQLVAGTNSWDAATHVMSGSNDLAARKQIFGWIAGHAKRFYRPRLPVSPVGVYFSPRTRNYSANEYLPSYFGSMALLMHSHLEFQVVTPRSLPAFKGEVLILPGAGQLGADELGMLDRQAKDRGMALVRDKTAGEYWKTLAGSFVKTAETGASLPETEAAKSLRETLRRLNYQPAVEISASPFLTAQIARVDGRIHVFFANFKGLKSKVTATQIPERDVKVSFPEAAGSRVFALPYLGQPRQVSARRDNGRLTCVIPEIHKGMVVWVE